MPVSPLPGRLIFYFYDIQRFACFRKNNLPRWSVIWPLSY
nr:MAG TPA: hypothetical protein [Caudoviricetes sp.]DAQ44149.1 MAG TPA: hypothetical protein [Bacteriophage sp.]